MESFLQFSDVFIDNIFLYILALFFAISFVVFVHELGHYSAARYFGVRVDKFSIGFGYELWGRTDKHGTRWSLSLLPLGGYVKIFGDVNPDDPKIWDHDKGQSRALTNQEKKIAFYNRKIHQRAMIIAAGPLINFLFTFFMLIALFSTKGQGSTPAIVTAVALGTSGYEAGFQPLDEIIAVDGHKVGRFEDIWDFTKRESGQIFLFTVRRSGQNITIKAASRPIYYKDTKGLKRSHGRLGATHISALEYKDIVSVEGVGVKGDEDRARTEIVRNLDKFIKIGIAYGPDTSDVFLMRVPANLNKSIGDPRDKYYGKFFTGITKGKFYVNRGFSFALISAARHMKTLAIEVYKVAEMIFGGGARRDSVGGIGTLGQAAGKAVDSGLYSFLLFLAVLSFQIAFVNLLPIPLLDGGYLTFLAYEAMVGKPLSQRFQDYAFVFGLVFLVGIMIFTNISDIFLFTR